MSAGATGLGRAHLSLVADKALRGRAPHKSPQGDGVSRYNAWHGIRCPQGFSVDHGEACVEQQSASCTWPLTGFAG